MLNFESVGLSRLKFDVAMYYEMSLGTIDLDASNI